MHKGSGYAVCWLVVSIGGAIGILISCYDVVAEGRERFDDRSMITVLGEVADQRRLERLTSGQILRRSMVASTSWRRP